MFRAAPRFVTGRSFKYGGLFADFAVQMQFLGSILIPSVALKQDEDVFLDDPSLQDLGSHLGCPAPRVGAAARGTAG